VLLSPARGTRGRTLRCDRCGASAHPTAGATLPRHPRHDGRTIGPSRGPLGDP
jgi:hypothetical protein